MAHGGNVIQELTADHREVDQMFAEIEARAAGDPRRRELADELTKELVRHSVAEEEYLYPAVRRFVDDGDDLADEEISDHAQVERMLKELEGCKADDPRFDALITRLRSAVTSHVADEEQRLFPLLAESCGADLLMELGDKVRTAKQSAPTRPHPSTSHTARANKLLAPGMGMVDRVRDLLTGRATG